MPPLDPHYKGFVNQTFSKRYTTGLPILSGGVVSNSKSETIFDYLNPGTAVDAAKAVK